MRLIPTTCIALVTPFLISASAGATLTNGSWAPVPSQTATYCLDAVCTELPFDASIGIGLPTGASIGLLQTVIRFTPAGRDFTWSYGATFASAEPPFDLTYTYPFMGDALTYHFESDVALTLSGFVRAELAGAPRMEVRFEHARFVPIPEPSVAALAGVGLLILAAKRSGPPESDSHTGALVCRLPTP